MEVGAAKKRANGICPLLFLEDCHQHRDVFDAYAAIDALSESIGISMGKNDVWIAAGVNTLQALLLTTDKDFDHLHPNYISRDWIDPALFKAK